MSFISIVSLFYCQGWFQIFVKTTAGKTLTSFVGGYLTIDAVRAMIDKKDHEHNTLKQIL